MALRFPGPATVATTALRWEAWTQPAESVRFPGAAEPGLTALRWRDWTRSPEPSTPPRPMADLVAPHRAPARATRATRTAQPAHDAISLVPSLGLQPLTLALAESHEGVARAHAAYLEEQRLNLDRLANLHERLVAIATR